MKIIKRKKISDIRGTFAVYGTKSELIKFEEILKINGIKDDIIWNDMNRYNRDCLYIIVYSFDKDPTYCYHRTNCQNKTVLAKDFI